LVLRPLRIPTAYQLVLGQHSRMVLIAQYTGDVYALLMMQAIHGAVIRDPDSDQTSLGVRVSKGRRDLGDALRSLPRLPFVDLTLDIGRIQNREVRMAK